jgi:replicative DNA helicase
VSVATLPPHSVEDEQALIGSLLEDRDAIIPVSQIVSASDFYVQANADIYTAIKSLYRKRIPADLVTVSAELDRFGRTESVGGIGYLSSLLIGNHTYVHAEYYANNLARLATLRRIIQTATETVQNAWLPDADPTAVVDRARKGLAEVAPESQRKALITMGDAIDELRTEIDLRASGQFIADVVPTGFYDLDRKMADRGFERGQLIIVLARPGVGKTALMLQMALNTNRHYVHTNQSPPQTVIFTTEMSTRALCWRALAEATGIPSRDLKRPGALTEQQRLRVVSQMTELAALPIVFADASGPTTDQMKDQIERLNAEREVRLVLFDYIERAGNRKSGNENEENRVGQVAAGLKSIAKDCGVTVVALSQANREVERSASHIPTLSSIRQSGRIEQEADIILGMYRHDYYVSIGLAQPKPESEGIAELHVLKNRDGEQGIVRLRFLPELTCFQNISTVPV